jgi:Protein of unknown function (DUF2721)
MLSNLPTMDQLQLVISQAAAPAFILGAVASFLSVLLSHMGRVIDRSRAIHDLAESDPKKERLKANLPQLRLRARILHRANASQVSASSFPKKPRSFMNSSTAPGSCNCADVSITCTSLGS